MPTNEQRRATAKRKLERQLERRAEQARKRRLYTIIGSAVAAIVVVGAVVATVVHHQPRLGQHGRSGHHHRAEHARRRRLHRRQRPTASCPPFTAPADLGADCQYPAARSRPASNNPPRTGKVPTDPAAGQRQHVHQPGQHRPAARQRQVAVHGQQLRQPGPAGLLQRHPVPPADHQRGTVGAAVRRPDRSGHRRARATSSPTSTRPTSSSPTTPQLQQPVVYPRGTLAMANAGPGTNGSQFFLVYKDSQLPPNYTVFGTIDETGLATLDKIAAGGVAGGGQDGAPQTDVQVKSICWTDGARDDACRRRRTARIRRALRPVRLPARRGRPTDWRSCRWSARSCSRRWASSSATSRCRRSRRPARRAAGWRSPGWSSAT